MAVRLDHPVCRVLRERRARGDRADGYKVGLAVQGGGMRGVLSGAMLTALEDLGFGDVFDGVYGASSGALNAAYFLAGRSWRNLAAYYDDLVSPAFLSVRRWRTGMMDLDFALGEVLCRRKPLDFAAVLGSATPLHVAITRLDPPGTELRGGFGDAAELVAALRASAWLPVVSRGVADCAGPAIDGAMLTIHPYRLALGDGCTHVLSLSSRRPGPVPGPYAPVELAVTAALATLDRRLVGPRCRAVRQYQQDRALLAATDPPDRLPAVLDVLPPRGVASFERSAGALLVAARQAYEEAYRVLSGYRGAGFATVPRFVPVGEEVADAEAGEGRPGGAAREAS
ncbi:patatin-like phospholipase family protein [Actinocatenispora comari]|uniref:patatin-like phospholipase family protein n=1 Tax=Actinocatenispora comari TaxID=2807577 RepID=UPI001A92F03B|nr:patatin-like phospholipase family protein [Actinocatenispora comari]